MMSSLSSAITNVARSGPLLLFSLICLSMVAAAVLFTVRLTSDTEVRASQTKQDFSELAIIKADGEALTLADLRGKLVLLNVWATWCAPCRKEMPALDRLQGELAGSDFEVVALSIDRTGMDPIRSFYEQTGIKNLRIYLDRDFAAMSALGITGVPTTLLIDTEGSEIQRWVGPVEWDSPEIVELIRSRMGSSAEGRGRATNSEPREEEQL